MRYLIALLLLLPTLAGAQTLTITVPVPPPAPISVTVNQQVLVGTVTYQFTGTLTGTPVTNHAGLPPLTDEELAALKAQEAALGVVEPDYGPILGARSAEGVSGSHFGALAGRVLIGGFPAPVEAWSPSFIALPLLGGETVTVVRADGLWHTSGAP
jgi:hypothetical protein